MNSSTVKWKLRTRTFGNGQGKELVVAIGNLVTICNQTAEWYGFTVGYSVSICYVQLVFVHSCLSTVKGRTTVTAKVEWDDGRPRPIILMAV